MDFSKVVSCKIYPGIGISRLGDSEEYFVAPELPSYSEEPAGGYKDSAGRIKRQAARFRVYAFDSAGKVVGECRLDEPGTEIKWTVTLANTKSSWHEFAGVAKGLATDDGTHPTPLRNTSVSDRASLEITPSPCTISGVRTSGPKYRFDDGSFLGTYVDLGEVRTDEYGRLIILGGHGKSGHIKSAKPIGHYANNDGWHDDAADGPVTAEVSLGGKKVLVEGAWVIVAPPDFSPFTDNIVTLQEVMRDTWTPSAKRASVSFKQDVYPILSRLNGYQWVSDKALRGHGPGKNGSFLSAKSLTRLRDNSSKNKPFRTSIFQRIRDPHQRLATQANYDYMPMLSGDEGDCKEGSPDRWMYLLVSQYDALEQWAAGNFTDDWAPTPATTDFDQIPVGEQPEALDEASLSRCVGGPFFPGIEITYISRNKSLYSERSRFDGSKLEAGDITKRMAVPWQADFFECQIHWWPAQRPDYVLNAETLAQGEKAFPYEDKSGGLSQSLLRRQAWDRGVGQRRRFLDADGNQLPDALPGDNDMVDMWSSLGFIVPRTTQGGEQLLVETGRSRYHGLSDRDYFYMMLNLDSYPEFRPKARELADKFLTDAWRLTEIPAEDGGVDDYLRFFPYSVDMFRERMDEIYSIMLKTKLDAEASDPKDQNNSSNLKSRDEVIERMRQLAPFNQLDGVWLRNISRGGPIDEIDSMLFSVWMDEVGDGNPNENHAGLYTRLLESVGIVLPAIESREYADNPDFLDSAFTAPLFELVVSEFTRTYYPEILGMTLQLEWEVLNLWPGIIRLDAWGIDAHFYRMHVGIDNAANGHGAKAREAVELYLDRVRLQTGSEDEVQRHWKRIWNGYVAFETVGTVTTDLQALLEERRKRTPETDLIELIERKKEYGRLNHGDKVISKELINDLFEDPRLLLKKLAADPKYVVPGSPSKSGFFDKLTFEGPMYKVFNDAEIALWRRWIEWLGQKPVPSPAPPKPQPAPPVPGAGEMMTALIAALKEDQRGTRAHQRYTLKGPDAANSSQTITLSVAEWFDQPVANFMSALADPTNTWIIPSSPGESRFITQLVQGDNAMGFDFKQQAPGTEKTWADVAVDWVVAGCPIPKPAVGSALFSQSFLRTLPKSAQAFRLTPYSSPEQRGRHPRGYVLGMGSVH